MFRQVYTPPPEIEEEETPGFDFFLADATDLGSSSSSSQGESGSLTFDTIEKTQLDGETIDKLLARASGMDVEEEDKVEFAMRQTTMPAPRTGETITVNFPSDSDLEKPTFEEEKELKVVRYLPEGEQDHKVPHLSITFNQPMVELKSVTETDQDAKSVASLTPQVEGRWKWIGTQTLFFEPERRFPMATEFTCSVGTETKSISGETLKEPVSFSFSTTPPKLVASSPSGVTNLRPTIFLEFDQKMNPQDVLSKVNVSDEGNGLCLVTDEEELKKLKAKCRRATKALEGHSLFCSLKKDLKPGSQITLTIGEGLQSAEGPLTTKSAQTMSFRTYDPLRVEHVGPEKKVPYATISVRLNNALDEDVFDAKMIKMEPQVERLKVECFGSNIQISGATRPKCTYTLTLSDTIKDIYDQTLEGGHTCTFTISETPQGLFAFKDGLYTVDPATLPDPTFSFVSTNIKELRVIIWEGSPECFPKSCWGHESYRGTEKDPLVRMNCGKVVSDEVIVIDKIGEEPNVVHVPLTKGLKDKEQGLGHVIVWVQPVASAWHGNNNYIPHLAAWIQATRLGVDVFGGVNKLVCFTNNIETGKAVSGVKISVPGKGEDVTSGEDGMAVFKFTDDKNRNSALVVSKGNDSAIVRHVSAGNAPNNRTLFNIFDDRGMYKPNEEVHIKGFVRQYIFVLEDMSRKLEILPEGTELTYKIRDSRNAQICEGSTKLGGSGSFDFAFKIPDNCNLGDAYIQLTLTETKAHASHRIKIQEFRRPEFKISVSKQSEGPFYADSTAVANVNAGYYSGGPLADSDVEWRVSSTNSSFSPPGWSKFTFGEDSPWFWRCPWNVQERLGKSKQHSSTTDSSGDHHLAVTFDDGSEKPKPITLSLEATVRDLSFQSISGETSLLVHPSRYYVGMKLQDKVFVAPNEGISVDIVVSGVDGKAVRDVPVAFHVVRIETVQKKGRLIPTEVDAMDFDLVSADGPLTHAFEFTQGGQWKITASVKDAFGGQNYSTKLIWVTGGKKLTQGSNMKVDNVTLIPNKEEYQPGDVAELMIQSPFHPCEGVLSINREGLVSTQRFSMENSSITLHIPIEDVHVPNLYVCVDLVGASQREDEDGNPQEQTKPARASGNINLRVPPHKYGLKVSAQPRIKTLQPGMTTMVDFSVKDSEGNPVENAEITLVVVDEAILSLSGYQIVDPLGTFYPQVYQSSRGYHSRDSLYILDWENMRRNLGSQQAVEPVLETFACFSLGGRGGGGPRMMARGAMCKSAMAPMAMMCNAAPEMAMCMDAGEGAPPPDVSGPQIQVRSNFNPLAAFLPNIMTDSTGSAQTKLSVPDTLTSYRLWAVAVSKANYYGIAEDTLSVSLPLMLRPSFPRFLNFGDEASFPVLVQNQTDEARQIAVAIRAHNAILPEASGWTMNLPANARLEARFKVKAEECGKARFQVVATSGDFADATEVSMPVWTPATSEAFATYGEIDEGHHLQKVRAPAQVYPQFGGVDVTLSSTAVQALTDALIYLHKYEFECSEQLASRILGIVSVKDVLEAFKTKDLPSPELLIADVKRSISLLEKRQLQNGGFGYWSLKSDLSPYCTVHIALALAKAMENDFDIPQDCLNRLKNVLKNIENHCPGHYSQRYKDSIKAFALYCLSLFNEDVSKDARALWDRAGSEGLSLESMGLLLYVLGKDKAGEIHHYIMQRVNETPETANFVTSYGDDGLYVMLHSDRRTDGILLETLIHVDRDNSLIPKLVKGLLAHKKQGRWRNTQENAFILLSLGRYFREFEKDEPDFVARVWLGEGLAADQTFKGRSTDRHHIPIPMSEVIKVASEESAPLVVHKEGPGRLYYRLGMTYAPRNLAADSLSQGFTVSRIYEGVDSPDHVQRLEDGSWKFAVGQRVRVKLTMVNTSRRYHVALVDKLPAGIEAINPALKGTGSIPSDTSSSSSARGCFFWNRTWFEHQNLRDERAEAFASLLWQGSHQYSYVARATCRGNYVAPPAKAEEMYSPELFGRSSSDKIVVE